MNIMVVHQKYRDLPTDKLKSVRESLILLVSDMYDKNELTEDFYQHKADIRILNDLIAERI